MIAPVQSPPVHATCNATPVSAAAVGPATTSKPPPPPFNNITGAAIEANLGGIGALPPLPTPPRGRAMAALDFGEKWANEFSRIADLSGVDLGGALNFAHADVRRLVSDLQHNAPDSTITQDTNRLLGDWATKGAQAFQALRHGLFQNTQHQVRHANADLFRAGVTSPEIHGAMQNLNKVLRMVDAALSGRPGGPIGGIGGGPIGGIGGGMVGGPFGGLSGGGIGGGLGQLQFSIDRAMAELGQAMAKDHMAHPEHAQALQGAMNTVTGSLRQLQMGLHVTNAMRVGMMQDLERLGGFPRPQPGPMPLPLPQPPPRVPPGGVVPFDAQAA